MTMPWPTSICEQSLLDAEQLLAIRITLHDIGGIFHDPEGLPLLGASRQSHRRFIICASGSRKRCAQHCGGAIYKQAALAPAPFEHTCWKGLREIVVPIKRDGILLAVLFAGYWRASGRGRARITGGQRDALAQAQKSLPRWDQQRAARLRNMLDMLGRGLIAEVDRLFKLDEQPTTRKAAILRFLKYNATRSIGLRDLAHAIALSNSRTSHLVRALFGMSFQTLLTRERITRAQTLLVSTDYSVKEIAQRVGMPNEYYFNRTFRKNVGKPPGQFRLSPILR